MMKAECVPGHQVRGWHSSVYRCGGSAGWKSQRLQGGLFPLHGLDFLLLPVELRRVNHTASTNKGDSTRQNCANPTIALAMANKIHVDQIDQITERVERLLLRYEEIQRTNALLCEQVNVLTLERDSLRSRLSAARARVDALIERLPESMDHTTDTSADTTR